MLNKNSALAYDLKQLRRKLVTVDKLIGVTEGGVKSNHTLDEAIDGLEHEMNELVKLIAVAQSQIDWYRKGVVN